MSAARARQQRSKNNGAYGSANSFEGNPALVVASVSFAEVALSGSKMTVSVTPGTCLWALRNDDRTSSAGQVFNGQSHRAGWSSNGNVHIQQADHRMQWRNFTHGLYPFKTRNDANHGKAISPAMPTTTIQKTCRCHRCRRELAQTSPDPHRAGTMYNWQKARLINSTMTPVKIGRYGSRALSWLIKPR